MDQTSSCAPLSASTKSLAKLRPTKRKPRKKEVSLAKAARTSRSKCGVKEGKTKWKRLKTSENI